MTPKGKLRPKKLCHIDGLQMSSMDAVAKPLGHLLLTLVGFSFKNQAVDHLHIWQEDFVCAGLTTNGEA